MGAPRASESSKRLEKHPGRGDMPCDNIYIVARSARLAASRVRAHGRTIRKQFPPRQPLPNIRANQ